MCWRLYFVTEITRVATVPELFLCIVKYCEYYQSLATEWHFISINDIRPLLTFVFVFPKFERTLIVSVNFISYVTSCVGFGVGMGL